METVGLERIVVGFAVVLGLLAVLAWALRRFEGLRGLAVPLAGARLALIESRWLDNRTRLVLVRWDDREHLLLLGGTTALVVGERSAPSPSAASGRPIAEVRP